MKTWKKWLLGSMAALAILLIIALALAPGFIHRYIEKNDKELIGREVTLDELNIQWLSGEVEIKGFDLKEEDDNTSFITYDRLFINLHLWSLFRGVLH